LGGYLGDRFKEMTKKFTISESRLKYFVHCKRTIDDIATMTGYSQSCIKHYLNLYDIDPYYECKICGESDFYELKSQVIKNQSSMLTFSIFNICESCYNDKKSNIHKKLHKERGSSILEKRKATSLKKYGVEYTFHKKSRKNALKLQKESAKQIKLNLLYQKYPYRSKDIFYNEYILNGKSLHTLCKEWGCLESVILKYVHKYNFDETYRCEQCKSPNNLIAKKGKNVLKYKPLCKICRTALCKDVMRLIVEKDNANKKITKEILEFLHNEEKLSITQICAKLKVGVKRIHALFLKYDIKEIKRCEKCGNTDNLFVSKTPKGKTITHNYCNACHSRSCSKGLSNKTYSKISQKLFYEIYSILPQELKTCCYFATLNHEYTEVIPDNFRNCQDIDNFRYNYDFCINYQDVKFVVEFNGDLWHANPQIYKWDDTPNPMNKNIISEDIWIKDRKRNDYTFAMGNFLIEVWEKDYHTNKQDTIDNIIMNINMVYYSNENKNLRSFLDAE
jgi:hypothetical protein